MQVDGAAQALQPVVEIQAVRHRYRVVFDAVDEQARGKATATVCGSWWSGRCGPPLVVDAS